MTDIETTLENVLNEYKLVYHIHIPFKCTKDTPWSPDKSERAIHPDAEYLGDKDYGYGEYCEKYKCPHCGKTFEVELPQ